MSTFPIRRRVAIRIIKIAQPVGRTGVNHQMLWSEQDFERHFVEMGSQVVPGVRGGET